MSAISNPPPLATVNRDELGGVRLLASDLWTAWLLVAEGEYRGLARLFGVRRDQTTMVTLIGAAMLAHAARESVSRGIESLGRPTLEDAAMGSGAVKEGLHMIAGPASRDFPLGSLIAIVVVAKVTSPAIRHSAHALRTASHRMHEQFDHRYGHLFGRNGKTPHLPQVSGHVPQMQRSG